MSNETEWVLVPREPTPEMGIAFGNAPGHSSAREELRLAWSAMLAAAPQPPAEAQAQVGGEVVAWRILWSPQFPETAELTSDGVRVQKVRALDDGPQIEPLYTAPPSAPVGVEDLIRRIDAAIERVTSGRCTMRVPADPTDPDLVLADAGNWIQRHALAQQPAADPLEEWANRPLNFTATIGKFEDGAVGKQPAAAERPVGWWNGILPDVTDRSPYGPSIHWGADAENSGHDIPLYAGVNPSRIQQPAAVDEAMAGWIADGDTIPACLIEATRNAIRLEFGNNGTDGYYKRILVRVFTALAAQQGVRDDR